MTTTPKPIPPKPSTKDRRELTADMQAILARTEAEDRDFTEAENARFDALRSERETAHVHISSKIELVEYLRSVGFAKSAAERVAASGWSGLDAHNSGGDAARLAKRVQSFAQSLRSNDE